MTISFFVPGLPLPAGSKRAFAIRKAGILTGRVAVVDANPKAKTWKDAVASAALQTEPFAKLLDCPLRLIVEFRMPRPRGHYGTGKNAQVLRTGSPTYPATRPDCTKLLRAIEDALTQVIWQDDSQIVEQIVFKRYTEDRPGAWIQIETMD